MTAATCTCATKTRPAWHRANSADFLQSNTCQDASGIHQAVYALLLHHAWVGPGLPVEIDRLAQRTGLGEALLKEVFAGPVGDKWERCCTRLWNVRMESERDLAGMRSASATHAAGMRWAHARHADRNAGRNAEERRGEETTTARERAEPEEASPLPTRVIPENPEFPEHLGSVVEEFYRRALAEFEGSEVMQDRVAAKLGLPLFERALRGAVIVAALDGSREWGGDLEHQQRGARQYLAVNTPWRDVIGLVETSKEPQIRSRKAFLKAQLQTIGGGDD